MSDMFDVIDDAESIVLLTHENPDGDAIGSVLAMYNYLISLGKGVDMIIPDVPYIYKDLTGIDNAILNTNKEYDLGIILDCATRERIGTNSDVFGRCERTIVIDHHISNTNYGDYNIVDGKNPATCQFLYEIFSKYEIEFGKNSLIPLAIGMITDTGGFQNSNTNANTFNIMSDFIKKGVDVPSLYRTYYTSNSMEQFNLHRIAMNRLEFFCNNKIAFTYITMDDFSKTNAPVGSHEGIVDIGRNINGVEVSILARECDNGYRVSLRSKDYVDVSKVASAFDGGGHIRAAGCLVKKKIKETKETLVDEVKKYIDG